MTAPEPNTDPGADFDANPDLTAQEDPETRAPEVPAQEDPAPAASYTPSDLEVATALEHLRRIELLAIKFGGETGVEIRNAAGAATNALRGVY